VRSLKRGGEGGKGKKKGKLDARKGPIPTTTALVSAKKGCTSPSKEGMSPSLILVKRKIEEPFRGRGLIERPALARDRPPWLSSFFLKKKKETMPSNSKKKESFAKR